MLITRKKTFKFDVTMYIYNVYHDMNNAWWHRLLFSKTKSGYSTQVTSKVCHTGMRMSLPKTEVKILSTSPLQVLYLIIFSI